MKARDAYVPFLLSKPLNKMYISELSSDIFWKNIIWYHFSHICWIIFYLNSCVQIIQMSILICGLDSRNGTYASVAFIFGVEHKNPSTGCGITAFWKLAKKVFFTLYAESALRCTNFKTRLTCSQLWSLLSLRILDENAFCFL